MATIFEQTPEKLQGVRSPVIVTLSDVGSGGAGFQYVLSVFYWTGSVTVIPASYNVRLKKPPLANGLATFNAGELTKSLFNNIVRPDQVNAPTEADEMLLNIAFKAGYEADAGDSLDNATSSITHIVKGYTHYEQGINFDLSSSVLSSRAGKIYLRENGYEILPIFWDSSVDVAKIRFEGYTDDVILTLSTYLGTKASITDSDGKAWYIPIGYSNLAAWDIVLGGLLTDIISGGIKKIWISDEFDIEINTWEVENVCEPKYTDGTIYFVNKYGMWDFINFFKKSSKTTDKTSKEYQGTRTSYDAAMLQSELSKPHYQKYLTQGREKVRVTTGYQDESLSILMNELLLSESILLQIGDERPLPVNLVDTSMPYKTGLNDGLISYDINFEYAHNKINTLGV